MNERFGEPLSDDDKERLYQESIHWYARYGLSMRPVPVLVERDDLRCHLPFPSCVRDRYRVSAGPTDC
jgi:hypothetical protein